MEVEGAAISAAGLTALRRFNVETSPPPPSVPPPPPGPPPPPPSAPEASPQNRVECSHCHDTYRDEKTLKNHLTNSKKCKRMRDPVALEAYEAEKRAKVLAAQRKHNNKRRNKPTEEPVVADQGPAVGDQVSVQQPAVGDQASVQEPAVDEQAPLEEPTAGNPLLGTPAAAADAATDAPVELGIFSICRVGMASGENGLVQLVCGHWLHETCRLQFFSSHLMDRIVELQRFICEERVIFDIIREQPVPRLSAEREEMIKDLQGRRLRPIPPDQIDLCLTNEVYVTHDGEVDVRPALNALPAMVSCPICRRWSEEIPLL